MAAWAVTAVFGFLAAVPAGQGHAALSEAKQLYEDGAFDRAASIAHSDESLDGYVLAARALLVGNLVAGKDPDPDVEGRAARFAREAVELDADHAEANLLLGIAVGRLAVASAETGQDVRSLTQESRRHLDRALAAKPDDPTALAASAAWHFSVIEQAGSLLARLVGADANEAREQLGRAVENATDDMLKLLFLAMSAKQSGAAGARRIARDVLERLLELEPANRLEELVLDRARAVDFILRMPGPVNDFTRDENGA